MNWTWAIGALVFPRRPARLPAERWSGVNWSWAIGALVFLIVLFVLLRVVGLI